MADGRSSYARYCDLILGSRSFMGFLLYEFVVTCFSRIPGALGLFLRSIFYPMIIGNCGHGIVFGTNIVLRHPGKIRIGSNAVIDDNCLLDAKGHDNKGIDIGDDVFIGRNSILSCKNGDIQLGNKVNIGFNCEVFSGSSVRLADETMVAAYCYFIGGDHHLVSAEKSNLEQGSCSRGIEVGEKCWFGAGVKVLDGIKIGQNSVIGAGAVVNKDIAEYSVAVGVPARVIRDRRNQP